MQILKINQFILFIMENFTHSQIQNFSTNKLKSIIKNGLVDIETEDMIFKELFEIRRIKEF
tara:strand:- start:45 stop:227 length:183 start_codon:yes stop_codon:yes gene_type:complete